MTHCTYLCRIIWLVQLLIRWVFIFLLLELWYISYTILSCFYNKKTLKKYMYNNTLEHQGNCTDKRHSRFLKIMFPSTLLFFLKTPNKCVRLRREVRAVWQCVMNRSVWGWELHFRGLTFSRRPLGRYQMLLPVIRGSKGSGNLPHPSSTHLSATLFPNPKHTHTDAPRQS